MFEDIRRLEDILQFGVGNESFLGEETVGSNGEWGFLVPFTSILIHRKRPVFQILRIQFGDTTAKVFIDGPGGKIQILRSVVIAKQLGIEGDDIVHIAVGHHHGIFLTKDIFPRTDGRCALTDINIAGLTVVVTEGAVGLLHHIGCPDHLGSRPVHHGVLPVLEVLAHPYLSRTIAVTRAVGRGIEIIGVAELPDGRVGEITRDKRIGHRRRIVGLSRKVLG